MKIETNIFSEGQLFYKDDEHGMCRVDVVTPDALLIQLDHGGF